MYLFSCGFFLSYANVTFTPVTAEILECGVTANRRSNGATSTNSKTIIRVINNTPSKPDLYRRVNVGDYFVCTHFQVLSIKKLK